jgi:hypothetical protein
MKSDVHRYMAPSSSPRIVSVRAQIPPSHDTREVAHPVRGSFFTAERVFMFLTIISAIVALCLALWSLHKHSEVNERISKINALMVDTMSQGKPKEKKESARTRYNAEAIKERLAQRRLVKSQANADLNRVAAEQFEQVKEAEIQQAQYINEFTTHTKKISQTVAKNRNKITEEAGKVNLNMKRIKAIPMEPHPSLDISTIKRPDPGAILSKPIQAVGEQIEKIAEKTGYKLDLGPPGNKSNKSEMGIFGGSGIIDMESVVPDPPAQATPVRNKINPVPAEPVKHVPFTVGNVDMDDLERDLLLLGNK